MKTWKKNLGAELIKDHYLHYKVEGGFAAEWNIV